MSYKGLDLKCLKCGELANRHTSVMDGNEQPAVGDVTICLYCGHVMEFGVGLVLKELSDGMLLEIAGNREFVDAVNMAKRARELAERKKPK